MQRIISDKMLRLCQNSRHIYFSNVIVFRAFSSGVTRKRANQGSPRSNGFIDKTLSLLDDPSLEDDRSRPVRQRGKISKPLEKPPKLVFDKASQGMSEAIADDMMDNMNDALGSNAFIGVFKGTDYASQIVEVSSVRFNQDYSHAHVTWTSDYLEQIFNELKKKQLSSREVRFSGQMLSNINNILQRNEGKFRSHFIRTFNFRRVPRIYFQHDQKLENIMIELKYLTNQ
jgi:ribosome-binding factor A